MDDGPLFGVQLIYLHNRLASQQSDQPIWHTPDLRGYGDHMQEN